MYFEILVLVQSLSIVLMAVECIYIFFKWSSWQHSCLFLYSFATLINNTGYLMEMTAHSSGEALLGTEFSYIGKVLIPLCFFGLVIGLCKLHIPRKIFMYLAGFHLLVLILVLTCEYNTLYYTGWTYVSEGIFPHNEFGHGLFYLMYMVLVILYMILGFIILSRRIKEEKNPERRILLQYMLICVLLEGGSFLLFLTGTTGGYDVTSLAYAISAVLMSVAIFKHNLMDTLELVKGYLVDYLSESIIAVDESDRVVFFNKPASEMYPDIYEGMTIEADKMKALAGEDGNIIRGEKVYMLEVQPLYQNASLRGTIYAFVDITEKQRYTMELKEQKEIAEAANESKSAFLSVVSHEIRTPMNAVVGMTELLLRDTDSLTEKQEKYLRNIKNSGSALVMIVNDILDQSKIEAGKMEIVEEAYELRPMISDVKMIIENRIGSKPIHLIYEVDEEIPRVLVGDSLRIRQILINLMNNAVKFTEEGYIKLAITCVEEEKNRRALRFSVEDSGQGIKSEDLSKLGEAFIQVDTKKNHEKEGTGLGLSISRDFISLMGGQLEVASEYGEGTEFYFTIWQGLASGMDVASESGVHKQAWQEEEQFTAPEARVLIVDDTAINLMITEELLAPIEMTVDTANSGEKALQMIEENRYDLIFMDYMMPYMNGVETTEKIRNRAQEYKNAGDREKGDYLRSVPIVALSGDSSEKTKKLFLMAGIDDFTEKPVELKRLKRLLLKWLPEDMIRS